jgi:hypothetical protein
LTAYRNKGIPYTLAHTTIILLPTFGNFNVNPLMHMFCTSNGNPLQKGPTQDKDRGTSNPSQAKPHMYH